MASRTLGIDPVGDWRGVLQLADPIGAVALLSVFSYLARNQGAARAAGQRPTAPKGGRFCSGSAQNFGGRG